MERTENRFCHRYALKQKGRSETDLFVLMVRFCSATIGLKITMNINLLKNKLLYTKK